jgi:hydroxyacylglutathione hydrolase
MHDIYNSKAVLFKSMISDGEKCVKIVDGVHLIDSLHCNCYLVEGEGLTLIDTGMPGQVSKIEGYISKKLGRPITDLKYIILTHCDIDHSGNARELRRITGAKIALHTEDADYISGKKVRLGPDRTRWDIDMFYKAIEYLMIHQKNKPFFEADILLNEDDLVSGLRVIHTPGHTPGSIALWDPIKRALFSGDTMIYTGKSIHGSPYRVSVDAQAALRSYDKLLELDFDILLGGHGKPLMPDASARARSLKKG